MNSLSLHKKWGWPVCHMWGAWSCLTGAGLSACAFQGEQQPELSSIQGADQARRCRRETLAWNPHHKQNSPQKWRNFQPTNQALP